MEESESLESTEKFLGEESCLGQLSMDPLCQKKPVKFGGFCYSDSQNCTNIHSSGLGCIPDI